MKRLTFTHPFPLSYFLRLQVLDRVIRMDVQRDRLPVQDLHVIFSRLDLKLKLSSSSMSWARIISGDINSRIVLCSSPQIHAVRSRNKRRLLHVTNKSMQNKGSNRSQKHKETQSTTGLVLKYKIEIYKNTVTQHSQSDANNSHPPHHSDSGSEMKQI